MAAGTCRSRGWASVAVAVQWIGGSRSPGDLHRNATRQDACKPETKGAPRHSKDTPGKGSCDRERYPWFVAQFWTESRIVGVVGFEQRIHDLVEGVPELADIMEPLLAVRRVLREKFAKLHRKVLLLARDNEVCQRLMTIPGVGPVVSLAFISTVDVPARFRNSKAVGPSL